jgi:hypothetical protein
MMSSGKDGLHHTTCRRLDTPLLDGTKRIMLLLALDLTRSVYLDKGSLGRGGSWFEGIHTSAVSCILHLTSMNETA